jgi:phage-related protein
MTPEGQARFRLEFYEDENGREVVLEWLRGLTPTKRRAIGVAMHEILAHEGVAVASTEFGTPLGEGLFEFRLRHGADEILARGQRRPLRERLTKPREKILLRVFFHPHGDRLILLLGGYDKGRNPGKKHQQAEIAMARQRLTEWRSR